MILTKLSLHDSMATKGLKKISKELIVVISDRFSATNWTTDVDRFFEAIDSVQPVFKGPTSTDGVAIVVTTFDLEQML